MKGVSFRGRKWTQEVQGLYKVQEEKVGSSQQIQCDVLHSRNKGQRPITNRCMVWSTTKE